MHLLATMLFGFSVFLFLYPRLVPGPEGQLRDALELVEFGLDTKPLVARFLLWISKPFIPIVKKLPLGERREKIRQLIFSSGFGHRLSVDEFISLKIFAFICFGLLGLYFSKAIGANCILTSVSFALVGVFVPDQIIKGRRKIRHTKIRRALPFVMDLMTLSVEAGLDFTRAVERVVERASPSPLVDELREVLQELTLGATRQEALQNMAWRIDMPEVSTFVSVLVQATQLGASIGETLRAQADKIRAERFIRAEKAGAEAAQKLLIPLILVIVPAIFLILLTPVVIKLFQSELF